MGKRFLNNKNNDDDNFDEFDEFDLEEGETEEEIPFGDEEEEEEKEKIQRPARPVKASKSPEVDILFQDEHILVVHKPAGVDSTRGQFSTESLLDILEKKLPKLPEPLRLVHRLDRETSGLMLLAKTIDAQRNLSTQWETRTVDKTYLVIIHGMIQPTEGTIDLPLKKTESQSRPVRVDHEDGKPAVTEYKVLEQYRQYALVEAHPITGRMHQIRVHFSSEGCPVLCDRHYGSPEPLYLSKFKRGYRHSERKEEEKPLIARLALHANRLEFDHPATNQRMKFQLDPPKDFSAAVKQLGKFGR
jgi:23S rRNA pseudouridine955/2504/2580 synthase/23S rRNA pseudouridine1911/1915/1917 synthase